MAKIYKNKGSNQYKITIPNEIIEMTKWDENTELFFTPFIQDPKVELDEKTPILLKGIKK
jgi:hypothetical protein